MNLAYGHEEEVINISILIYQIIVSAKISQSYVWFIFLETDKIIKKLLVQDACFGSQIPVQRMSGSHI